MAFRSLRSLHRLLAGGAFALLLAVGQQHAVLHWLSHAITSARVAATEADHLGAGDAGDFTCGECIALAAFGASSPALPWTLDFARPSDAPIAAPSPRSATTALRLAFRSRAPPILS